MPFSLFPTSPSLSKLSYQHGILSPGDYWLTAPDDMSSFSTSNRLSQALRARDANETWGAKMPWIGTWLSPEPSSARSRRRPQARTRKTASTPGPKICSTEDEQTPRSTHGKSSGRPSFPVTRRPTFSTQVRAPPRPQPHSPLWHPSSLTRPRIHPPH